ncbi:putative fatty acyl-CoA reductase CG5065 isoform X2 [Leptidea sinapis]|nr:putative fatty acyl-CoA reductase CG5065 isoform X2 [Leptidea sinapis]
MTDKPYPRVCDYYAGRSVFITGGTGFLGKVLIERLLYNCTEIENIFVLIRPKKGVSTQKRLEEMTNVPLFTKLKQTRPDDLKKLVPVEGDITAPELGIKSQDEETLINKVSVVFHSAATVKFANTFKTTMDANVGGTRKVLSLSKKLKNINKFVYISTAFSNPDRLVIDEVLYEPSQRLKEIGNYYDNQKEHNKKELKKLLDGMPNAYTISKAISEHIVSTERGNMSVIVVRPSIVTPVIKDPLPGWADTWIAATALFSDMARGLMTIMYGNEHIVGDLVPVDYVCNFTIIAAAQSKPRSDDVPVYNFSTSSVNPITYKRACGLFVKEAKNIGYSSRVPDKILQTESDLVARTVVLLHQYIPSFFKDIGLRVTGRTPRYLQESKRSSLLRELLKPFTTTSWLINSQNTQALIASLDEKDKTMFSCDVSDIDWEKYMPIFCAGVKKYLINGKVK